VFSLLDYFLLSAYLVLPLSVCLNFYFSYVLRSMLIQLIYVFAPPCVGPGIYP
jgi:hypothetical protein